MFSALEKLNYHHKFNYWLTQLSVTPVFFMSIENIFNHYNYPDTLIIN